MKIAKYDKKNYVSMLFDLDDNIEIFNYLNMCKVSLCKTNSKVERLLEERIRFFYENNSSVGTISGTVVFDIYNYKPNEIRYHIYIKTDNNDVYIKTNNDWTTSLVDENNNNIWDIDRMIRITENIKYYLDQIVLVNTNSHLYFHRTLYTTIDELINLKDELTDIIYDYNEKNQQISVFK